MDSRAVEAGFMRMSNGNQVVQVKGLTITMTCIRIHLLESQTRISALTDCKFCPLCQLGKQSRRGERWGLVFIERH